jgi:hypothetical protein
MDDDIKIAMLKRMYTNIIDAIDLIADWAPSVLSEKDILFKYVFPAMKEFGVTKVPPEWQKDYKEYNETTQMRA